MNYHDHEFDIVVNCLNYKVDMFRGCSLHEMVIISLIFGALSIFVCCFLLHILFGVGKYGSILGLLLTPLIVQLFVKRLQQYKQNKPKGYVKQSIFMHFDNANIIKTPVNRRGGIWMIGRRA